MDQPRQFLIVDSDALYQTQKSLDGTHLGVVYAIEFGDKIKIGYSKKPYSRIANLKKHADRYEGPKIGRVCVSVAHTNFREMERFLHDFFSRYRVGDSELFNISLDFFLEETGEYRFGFKDESAEFEASSKRALESIQSAFLSIDSETLEYVKKTILENPEYLIKLYEEKIRDCQACISILEELREYKNLGEERNVCN